MSITFRIIPLVRPDSSMNSAALSGRVYETALTDEVAASSTGAAWLRAELTSGPASNLWGPLFYSETNAPVFWAQNIWLEPFQLQFSSIKEASGALRAIQRNWNPSLFTCFRRGELIHSQLPPLSHKRRAFPWQVPDAPVGAWTLLDEHTIIASAHCTSPFPGGVIEFEEDRDGPPSRAYLKLWEALTRVGARPLPTERCLDAGASPGGWTWALARLNATVLAVDRAPLAERVAAMRGVSFLRHDAFTLKPEDVGAIDWLFCDVVCYPPRLYEWVEKWLASGLCRNFVCTIKMQGAADVSGESYEAVRRFAAIQGSCVTHLFHNKHELTWLKIERGQ